MNKNQKKKSVAFTLDPSVVEWLRAEAARRLRSMSFIVNEALKDKANSDEREGEA